MKSCFRKINYYETDKMGVVHHSNYFRFFEEARTSFMEQAGFTYPRLEAEGIISPVTAISCRFHRPVKYGETVRIDVRLTSMTRTRCAFSYEVLGEDGTLRATGESEHCYLDASGRPVNIQRTSPEFFAVFSTLVDGPEK